MKKYVIIGLGSFGKNLVRSLSKQKGVEIIAVDIDGQKVNEVKDYCMQPIVMDATVKDNLVSIGIEDVDAVVVSSGPGLEPSIITVHILKQLGVSKIIAKALTGDHEKILYLVGATEVVYPERDVADKLGEQLNYPNLIDYMPMHSGFVLQEIATPDAFIGKTLEEIHLRKKFNVTVIAIKSLIPESIKPNPGGDFVLKESDILMVFGTKQDIIKFDEKISKLGN
jgi:trk system potassium uptake protein TrkA